MTHLPEDIPQETILKLGAEGGSLELTGRRLGLDQWEFTLHKSSMGAELDDPWTYKDANPVNSWDEALALLSQANERWFSYYLVNVHPEFHARLYKEVRQQLAEADNISQHWKKRI